MPTNENLKPMHFTKCLERKQSHLVRNGDKFPNLMYRFNPMSKTIRLSASRKDGRLMGNGNGTSAIIDSFPKPFQIQSYTKSYDDILSLKDWNNYSCTSRQEQFLQHGHLNKSIGKKSIHDIKNVDPSNKSDWSGFDHLQSSIVDSRVLQQNLTKMMVKVGSDPVPSDLDRIQDLFPTDNLYLYDKDPLAPRSKTLIRKRSTTASRLQRALSAGKNKIVPTEKPGTNCDVIYSDTEVSKSSLCSRNYVMDTAVLLTSGVQSQERHLFLFSDVMVIAKIRASGNYKLKDKVRVAEMWLSNCVEVVCEVVKSGEASFVMGWPTTNVVATFSSTHTRDLWLAKLKQLILEHQNSVAANTTSIRVHYWDPITKEECAQNVSVSQKDTVSTCIVGALKKLDINPNDADSYQLWVKVDRDSAPYPLIGHESPFAIKMNCLYVALAAAGGNEDAVFESNRDNRSRTLESSVCPVLKCYFILRSAKRGSFNLVAPKKGKRVRKSPILQKVFRRSLSKPELLDKTGDTDCLFGQSLTRITRDRTLPKPIMNILTVLYEKGPYTTGIFRKSANARACRELREKLNRSTSNVDVDCVDSYDPNETSILVLAAIIKEFLRCLPDCLLLCGLYNDWMALSRLPTDALRVQEARRLLDKLPPANVLFLKYFLCVLWHVQRRSSENMMTANNLAVCVGPSLLWSKSDFQSTSFDAQSEASKVVPAVVEFLILRCSAVLGDDCHSMFDVSSLTSKITTNKTTSKSLSRQLSRQDSGNEESDSLHSSAGLMRRDDSSIDSLEHALLISVDSETSPKLPSKSAKMSLTNLSRDSGLTMSDTQLYTPDDEAATDDSEASSGRGGSSNRKLTVTTSTPMKPSAPSQTSSSGGSTSSGYRSTYDRKSNHYHFSKVSVAQTQSLTTMTSPVDRLHDVDVENIYGNRMTSSQFPLGDRKDVIKRRLSRPRAWARPASSYGSPQSPQPMEVTSLPVCDQFNNPLRKSASEESLLSNYNDSSFIYSTLKVKPTTSSATAVSRSRPRQTENNNFSLYGTMVRSKSVHHVTKDDVIDDGSTSTSRCSSRLKVTTSLGRQAAIQWHHTRSSPHIELSYDSSTISDNDSTPHISRSNSRGKEYSGGVTNCDNYSELKLYGRQMMTAPNVKAIKDPNNNSLRLGGLNSTIDVEIHRAAPARIENSDEEFDSPAPPLPPKPNVVRSTPKTNDQRWSGSGSRERKPVVDVDIDWYENGVFGRCNRTNSPAHHSQLPIVDLPAKTTVISGKRVLTATQSNYDVPVQWRTARVVAVGNRDTCKPTLSSRGRTATPRLPPKGSQLRAKSQPPLENRCSRDVELIKATNLDVDAIYDCPPPTRPQKNNKVVTGSALTVGRNFRKEFSRSVSHFRSLFSKNNNKESVVGNDGGFATTSDVDNRMWLDDHLRTAAPSPPPYRLPPRVMAERNANHSAVRTWTSRTLMKSSVVTAQDAVIGGEESYV